VNRADNLTTFK